jgi:hypothetical protein
MALSLVLSSLMPPPLMLLSLMPPSLMPLSLKRRG